MTVTVPGILWPWRRRFSRPGGSGALSAALLATAFLVGCGNGHSGRGRDAPDSPGRLLYAERCAICHGMDGAPRSGAESAADLADPRFQEKWDRNRIADLVLEGKGEMPSFAGKLNEEEADAVAAYVKSWSKSGRRLLDE